MAEPFFIKNRKKLFSKLEQNSVAVLFAGNAPTKRGDEKYPFSPDRNFYYVSGIDKQNCILFFTKNDNEVTLYIERDNGILQKWVGANITEEQAKLRLGAQEENDFYIKQSNYVIVNEGEIEKIEKQVEEVMEEITSLY